MFLAFFKFLEAAKGCQLLLSDISPCVASVIFIVITG